MPVPPTDFARALAFTLAWEGGWSDDPQDHGGPTACGITLPTARAYGLDVDGDGDTDVDDLKRIPPEAVAMIYRIRYWDQSHACDCPWPVSAVVFDAAVNSGVDRSIRWLQKALGCGNDGLVGPVTLMALRLAEPHDLAVKCIGLREAFLTRIATGDQRKFLRGWLNRIKALRALVEA